MNLKVTLMSKIGLAIAIESLLLRSSFDWVVGTALKLIKKIYKKIK